jgi:hypothetical protein
VIEPGLCNEGTLFVSYLAQAHLPPSLSQKGNCGQDFGLHQEDISIKAGWAPTRAAYVEVCTTR